MCMDWVDYWWDIYPFVGDFGIETSPGSGLYEIVNAPNHSKGFSYLSCDYRVTSCFDAGSNPVDFVGHDCTLSGNVFHGENCSVTGNDVVCSGGWFDGPLGLGDTGFECYYPNANPITKPSNAGVTFDKSQCQKYEICTDDANPVQEFKSVVGPWKVSSYQSGYGLKCTDIKSCTGSATYQKGTCSKCSTDGYTSGTYYGCTALTNVVNNYPYYTGCTLTGTGATLECTPNSCGHFECV